MDEGEGDYLIRGKDIIEFALSCCARDHPQITLEGYRIVYETACAARARLSGAVPYEVLAEEMVRSSVEQFGPLARTVLEMNGLRGPEDLAAAVRYLTRSPLFKKDPETPTPERFAAFRLETVERRAGMF